MGKPVFMHCREASSALREVIGKAGYVFSASNKDESNGCGAKAIRGGVVHCFTGTTDEAKTFVGLGLHIGITDWICDDREGRSKGLCEAVRCVPAGKLMVETDAPYLTPRTIRPNRNRPWRNEPCLLPHVMSKVAEAREQTMEDLSAECLETTNKFFQLGF